MAQFGPDQIRQAAQTPRWAALAQIGGVAADLHNFDPVLVREPRLLVPVDVQALVVRAGVNDTEPMVTLPFREKDEAPSQGIHDLGTPRPPGVHLLWSVPAALGHGTLVDDPQAPGDASRRTLQLPALPDRWVVLRLAVPSGGRDPLVTGWVVEADTATVTPLSDWPSVSTNATTLGTAVPPPQLTLHVGGASWAQCYDAATGRMALHDPLTDLAGTELEGDAVSYVVAGWWSSTSADPLDGVGSEQGYARRLAQLGWNDPDHPSTDTARRDQATERTKVATTFGLESATRFSQPVETAALKPNAASAGTSGLSAVRARALTPAMSGFLDEVVSAALLPPAPTRSTLLHGRLHGVPLGGPVAPDNRPAAETLRVGLGASTPDLAAAMTVAGSNLDPTDDDARRAAERLLAAFSAGLLDQLDGPTVWADVEDYEHAHTYGSLPGGVEGVDRFVDTPAPSADPGSGFRPGKVATPKPATTLPAAGTVLWSAVERPFLATSMSLAKGSSVSRAFDAVAGTVPPPTPAASTVREVVRPAPRYSFPAAPVAAVAGGGRTLSAVEREEADGALICRLSDQTSQGHPGLLAATELLTSIGSAAVPDEVLELAREALAEDPYLSGWRARRAAEDHGFVPAAATARFVAEAALAHAYYTADDARVAAYTGVPVDSAILRQQAVEGLLRLSLSQGTWAHPEGVSMWGQPWRPLFCDWELTLELGGLDAWSLDGSELVAEPDVSLPDSVVIGGRSPLVPGVANTLASGIDTWLTNERQRDLGGHGLADPATETALAALRQTLAELDLMSVALDGTRERLLGLSYDRGLVHDDDNALPDGTRRATAQALPRLLAAGRASLTGARLVDAFGRLLDLPLDAVLVPARVADSTPRLLELAPRLTSPSRWRFDLVDATSTAPDATLACVDQSDPTKQVTPIAGFLLPDHMDESLEFFSANGAPLGELLHDAFSDAVTWEISPGRTDVAPAAGPTDDPDLTHHRVGWIAAGLVAADAALRKGTPDRGETESPLSVLLRAIDTTLWTVDPFGSLGTEHIAGLVGRPVAVVAARLSLDVYDDVADRFYADDTLRTGRQAAFDALAALELPVRLGEVTRPDDSLLGYFVDDDYSHFHLVDKVIADEALPSGRCKGVLADDAPGPLTPVPIDPDHPYIDASGILRLHPGQTVRLTLLMHPGGSTYLTSGLLPRTSRALKRDWVEPGLRVLAPSLRCGPLLIDADKVRLPKVASFPADQLFTHRDTPTSWRDDPILAATQSALLPDQQPEVQEGWVRIAPAGTPTTGSAGTS